MSWRGILLAAGLLALALLCRAYALGASMTSDEAHSVAVASYPLSVIPDVVTRYDAHPPAYYALLKAVPAGQRTPIGVRMPSLLLGLVQLLLLFLLGRAMGSPWAGVGFAALAAGSLLLARQSCLARNYMLLTTLMTGAWLMAVHALEQGGWWRWTLVGVLMAASFWTFYFALPAALALAAFIVLARPGRRGLVGAAYAGLLALLLFVPWLPHLQEQLRLVRAAQTEGGFVHDASTGAVLRDILLRGQFFGVAPWGSGHALVALALAALAAWFGVRSGRLSPPMHEPQALERWWRPLLAAIATYIFVVVLLFLGDIFVHPRYAGVLATLWIMAVGIGLARHSRFVATLLLVALVVGSSLHTVVRTRRVKPVGARAATAQVLREASKTDVVLCIAEDARLLFDFHAGSDSRDARGVFRSAPTLLGPWHLPMLVLDPDGPEQAWHPEATRIFIFLYAVELGAPNAREDTQRMLEQGGYNRRSTTTHASVVVERWAR